MTDLYRRLENWWFRRPKQLRFLAVGGFNTLFSYVLFIALTLVMSYEPALFLTYLISINLSIFTMRYYVFRGTGNLRAQYGKAALTYLGMILANYAALRLMIDGLSWDAWLAQAAFTLLSTCIIYLLHQNINFRS